MLGRVRPRLTYGNVVSTLCLFLLLGGGAYAALRLPKNSVGTKQIKKEAITDAKIKNGTIRGDSLNLATFGTVPSANTATTAGNANALGGVDASAYQRRIQWATVAEDGTIIEQSGGITVQKEVNNQYLVNFGSSVVGRGVMVSARYKDPDFTAIIVETSCAGPAHRGVACEAPATNNPDYVYVQTHTLTENTAEGFNIMVTP